MPQVAIVGAGATGTRVARQLARSEAAPSVILIDDAPGVASSAARSLGEKVTSAHGLADHLDVSIVVLATRSGSHAERAQEFVASGYDVISVGDDLADVRSLLDLDEHARSHGARIVVGAGMMPGLSDLFAAHGASWFDEVREIHVSKFGTGGPDCARQHHSALKGMCFDWRDDAWVRRAGGSGRELEWFPPPVEAADCYRAALADPLLLVRAHAGVERVTARMAATRRDRLTMHLPMLRRPHPEGLLGAVRVELRGVSNGAQLEVVLGCAERPAVAAGAVAATAVIELCRIDGGDRETGAKGLAEWFDPLDMLHRLRTRGLRPEIFVGAENVT